jgi:hypothetical protein
MRNGKKGTENTYGLEVTGNLLHIRAGFGFPAIGERENTVSGGLKVIGEEDKNLTKGSLRTGSKNRSLIFPGISRSNGSFANPIMVETGMAVHPISRCWVRSFPKSSGLAKSAVYSNGFQRWKEAVISSKNPFKSLSV